MLKRISKKMLLLFLGDIFLIISAQLFIYNKYYNFIYNSQSYDVCLILTTIVFVINYYIFDLYDTENNFSSIRYLTKFIITIIVSVSLLLIGFYLIYIFRFGRGLLAINVAIIALLTYFWRLILSQFFLHLITPKRVVIIGAGWAGKDTYSAIKRDSNYKVIGFLDDDENKVCEVIGSPEVIGTTNLIPELIKEKKIDMIILAITHQKNPQIFKYMLDAKMSGISVQDVPSFHEIIEGKVPVEHLKDSWFIYTELSGLQKGIYNKHIKRIFDAGIAFLALIITLPITILVSILIKLDSKGSIFFVQDRIGLNNVVFKLIKFRSMRIDEKSAGDSEESRITRFGQILRKLRIDEVPQFWNVFRGDMSLIGPRPLVVPEVEDFTQKVPYFSIRHFVRPGITGWAQVNYKHGATEEDALKKLQYDLYYIKNLSFMTDLHILIKTVKVVLWRKGAK